MNNVIFTKLSFYRNVKDYKFLPKLKTEEKNEIVEKVKTALGKKLSLIDLQQTDEKVVESLKKKGFIVPGVSNVFVGKGDTAVLMFNGEHIQIASSSVGFDKKILTSAKEIIDLLFNKISMAYNDEYGFLMSNINNIGSGLTMEAQIALVALESINKIDQVKQNVRKLGYVLSATKQKGIYCLKTTCNLGNAENEIMEDFEKMLTKLQDLENESAKMIDVSQHDELVDKSMRSVAILKSAYLLSPEELNDLLLNIRVGLNLGLVGFNEKTLQTIQELIVNNDKEIVSQSELKDLAEKVRNILKGEDNV